MTTTSRARIPPRRAMALLLVALVLGAGASASSLPDALRAKLKELDAAAKKADPRGIVTALESALEVARSTAPLELRTVAVINHDHTGLGLFTPAPGGIVQGRRLRLYLEVVGQELRPVTPGVWQGALDVDGSFWFEDPEDGRMELGIKPLGSQRFETRTEVRHTSLGVDIALGEKSPAGRYGVLVTVKDPLSGESASQQTAFVLR